MEFKDSNEIIRYLAENFIKGKEYSHMQVSCICLPVFMSPLMEDTKTLMNITKWVEFRTGKDMCMAIAANVDLTEEPLTLSKFHVLCGIRGPVTLENFEFEVIKKMDVPLVQTFARHKDFPMHLKTEFYNVTGETEYLPQEAQDIFVF